EAPAPEEIEGARAPRLRHPAGLAELDRDRRARQSPGNLLQVSLARARGREPPGHLEKQVGELPRRAQRLEGHGEAPPELVAHRLGQLVRVDAPLPTELGRQLALQVPV